ncbi:MAG: hypothetical protein K1X31_01105 [Gemmatimonadaceae bacterium]|nr:hypothetical protein [Gemmatimonadaceae bacterium]
MATRLIALAVLALSLLPIAGWLPGGESDVEYAARLLDWTYGLALCGGIGGLAVFLTRARLAAGGEGTADHDRPPGSAGTGFAVGVGLAAAALYALIARTVFSGRPLLIDEIVQVLQARWYAAGHVWVPTPEPREFFSILHLVDLGPRTYSQFPAGGPAMLALGSLVGAEWLVGPVVGFGCVWLFARLLRALEPEASRRWHRGAVALFAVAPFGAFMFGSHMNHATTLLWLLVACVGLAAAAADETASPWWGLLTGLGLGVAATIRPVDAAAFALPAAGWLLWRARRGGKPMAVLLASGVGVAAPLAALLYVNAQTTGRPLLFGYDLLWGAGHGLGFHRSPWGPVHTPMRGLELVSLYLTRLSVYLFETPFPALLPAAGALWWHRTLRPLDRYLLVSAGLVLTGYWAYWHDGFYLGPRFMVPLLPVLVLWSARWPRALATRFPARPGVRRASTVTLVAGGAYAALSLAMVRVPQYRNGMTSMRADIEAASQAADVHGALVLVKESWGAQLVVRMWARGIARSDAEVLYRNVDACRLELALDSLEAADVRGLGARAVLVPLQSDSARLVKSDRSPDYTERMLPGLAYPPRCEARIREDQAGFSHLAPLRLARDGNVYARWLPGREREIAARFPERAVYLLGRRDASVGAPFTFTRLRP